MWDIIQLNTVGMVYIYVMPSNMMACCMAFSRLNRVVRANPTNLMEHQTTWRRLWFRWCWVLEIMFFVLFLSAWPLSTRENFHCALYGVSSLPLFHAIDLRESSSQSWRGAMVGSFFHMPCGPSSEDFLYTPYVCLHIYTAFFPKAFLLLLLSVFDTNGFLGSFSLCDHIRHIWPHFCWEKGKFLIG